MASVDRPDTDHAIRFLHGGSVCEISDCDPTATVLDYLRLDAGLTGTKEGCAEGDCGACTVVVGELHGERLAYRALNACILLLPSLHGKQLITVEDLRDRDRDRQLHPAQQLMVDYHGAQCGFCTPGIVMSLFALTKQTQDTAPLDQRINDALAGNLCRCTGYAPIRRAAEVLLQQDRSDQFDAQTASTVDRLQQIQPRRTLHVSRDDRHYFVPTDLQALCTLLNEYPEACMVAGATDIGLWITKDQQILPTVIYLGNVAELKQIKLDRTAGYLEIGAAVTYSDAMEPLCRWYPDFKPLLRRLGAAQVRNAGTIGGNIANGSPIGDMPPGLIAIGAELVLSNTGGSRRIALEDFFIDYGKQDLRPGECVEKILIPLPSDERQFRTYKLSKRLDQDISAVCAAYGMELSRDGRVDAIRIAYGGMAATPKRAHACEQALIGRTWDQAAVDAAQQALAEDYQPISDWRASADYRLLGAQNLLQRFYLETSGGEHEVRLSHRPLPVAEGQINENRVNEDRTNE